MKGYIDTKGRKERRMSDDSISRQQAIDEINKLEYPSSLVDVKRIIVKLPSAEPKTGEWIKATGMMPPEFHGHHCCSECGNFANMEPPFGSRENLSKFCPNCGADMRGEQDGREG